MPKLVEGDIASRLEGLSDWNRKGDEIQKVFKRKNFVEAMQFVNKVADLAEGANHHPDILVHGWNKVQLTVTNHSAGGLTEADFGLAHAIDAL